jgi:hypothetical protein
LKTGVKGLKGWLDYIPNLFICKSQVSFIVADALETNHRYARLQTRQQNSPVSRMYQYSLLKTARQTPQQYFSCGKIRRDQIKATELNMDFKSHSRNSCLFK